MTLLLGDRPSAPYLRRDRDELLALLPPNIDRVSVTHGGYTFSVYLYSGDRLVSEAKGCRSVRVGVERAARLVRETT